MFGGFRSCQEQVNTSLTENTKKRNWVGPKNSGSVTEQLAMRRKKNKANQNVILQALPVLPVGIVNQIEAAGLPNGAKSAQVFIMIDELLAAL
jgi:hypothetical protein